MGATTKPTAKRSMLWIIPVCVTPGLVSPGLRVFHLGALELVLVLGVASVAGFAAVATWAALRLRAGRQAVHVLEGGAQSYRVCLGVCLVCALLLTIKVAPFACRAFAP